MARKIKCDCGGDLLGKSITLGHIETEAMVCDRCDFTNLTKEQAEKYAQLKQLHEVIDSERRIIKIGNSFGITFP